MFTGIIEQLRPVVSIRRGGASSVLTLDLGPLAEGSRVGDSIAVNGICLTANRIEGASATFDVSTETLARSAFAVLKPADRVNVERSLRVGDRVGGHFVSGHIDGVARIATKRRDPGQWTFVFQVEPPLADMLIEKGSVAVDGISLTVVDLRADSFSVAVIPHTFDQTTLSVKAERDIVNIEADMMGKWVKKLLANYTGPAQPSPSGLSMEKLREQGFMG